MNAPGKKTRSHHYLHVSQLRTLDSAQSEQVAKVIVATGVGPDDFNVVKWTPNSNVVSLLQYSAFLDEAFPALSRSWTVNVEKLTVRFRTYEDSLNPPILHRKELLLSEDFPGWSQFRELTKTAEQIGLFSDPHRIGFQRAWEAVLLKAGYRVIGNDLVPIGNDEADDRAAIDNTILPGGIARHLTAISRSAFSAPVQALARSGFLDGSQSVFDYGCGRGDDLKGLRENGITANGWDPHYVPSAPKFQAHIVNLGFVLNVIEDLDERAEALLSAYSLATELLVVSAMLATQDSLKGIPYGDGVLTSRKTFQKYYSQNELREFVRETLAEEPLPIGPGIFFVFRDKQAEQRFLYDRVKNGRKPLRVSRMPRPARPARVSMGDAKYERYRESIDRLWERCLALGRVPDRSEVDNFTDILDGFGSVPAAIRFVMGRTDGAGQKLKQARDVRTDDLRLYLATMQFERRKPYKQLESRLQRDIREFFGDYATAAKSGRELLFAIANVAEIEAACQRAAEHGIGWLDEGGSLQLHTSLVERLPVILRAYVHCGTHLYGDISSADLLKIHVRTGKLTLMKFDDFMGHPLPKMLQRVKMNLRTQGITLFDYSDEHPPPYLYYKSRFMNEEFSNYAEQLRFEEALDRANIIRIAGYGPSANVFDKALADARYCIEGYTLVRRSSVPDLDSSCGRFFKYRDLIECGETQLATGCPNVPARPETYTALFDLAKNVLDPVIEYFGMVRLTFGFCSPQLARQIPGRIAPALDQHAAHELNRQGKPVCERLGAAVDFLVEDENMFSVAIWICENLRFHRMYVYGPDRPIHVSYGLENMGQVVRMVNGPSGRLLPRVLRSADDLKH